MCRRLVIRYGAIAGVQGADFRISAGEAVAIVGPNGAGKTSLLSAIAGIVRPAAGTIHLGGRPLAGFALSDVVRQGVALVPEGRNIFGSLTVMENLRLGGTVRRDASVSSDIDQVFADFPILGERREPAGQLSGGEQQMLAIARAMLSRPRLLMLDEPSLGLAPAIVDKVYELLRQIRDQGVSLLVVEQNASRAFALADRACVMNSGAFTLTGSPSGDRAPRRLRRRLFRGGDDRRDGCGMIGQVVQVLVDAVSVGGLYALTALGIGLIFGVMRLINFAHAQLIMIAGYAVLLLFARSAVLAVAGAVVGAGLLALLIERTAFRPLRGADPATLLIASFAVSFFIEKTMIMLRARGRRASISCRRWQVRSRSLASGCRSSSSSPSSSASCSWWRRHGS